MRVVVAYTAVVLIWSTTPLGIKFSTDSLSFIAAVGLRMLMGALLCQLICIVVGQRVRWDRQAVSAYAAAAVGIFGAMSFACLSMTYISSGLVSLIFGLAPLLSGLMARPLLQEPAFTRMRLFALALAMLGLGVVFSGTARTGAHALPGLLFCLVAVSLFSLSGVLVKRQAQGMSALEHTTGSLLFSLPLFAVAWMLIDGTLPMVFSARSLMALAYLSAFGSVLGFMLYFFVLQKLGATQVALIPLITPVFAMALGNVFAYEAIDANTVWGGALILLALMIYQLHQRLGRLGVMLLKASLGGTRRKAAPLRDRA